MTLEESVAVSLFYADGSEISATPFREQPADMFLAGLRTDAGALIECLDQDAGEFIEIRTGHRLYAVNPIGETTEMPIIPIQQRRPRSKRFSRD